MTDAAAFRADLDLVPSALFDLATAIERGDVRWPVNGTPRRILLLGMGSSYFAAAVIARQLRKLGVDAVAERSSVAESWPPSPDLLVIAISASGGSAETLAAVEPYAGRSHVVALTNVAGSPITIVSNDVVEMLAGEERGGVACRSYRHTIAVLSALAAQLGGGSARQVADGVRAAARANGDLLDRVDAWLPPALAALASPDGTWLLAPAERMSSALQGALMIREGPRRRADGCETGDWSHVDVYLTKTLDYRALVFAGSRWDDTAAQWMIERGSVAVAVGHSFGDAAVTVRYQDDSDPLVALLTEVLVAELIAAEWWLEGSVVR